MPTPLSPVAQTALRVLTEQATDGYNLMSKTGQNAAQLVAALGELRERGLVVVKGELNERSVGDAYIVVMPSEQGRAMYMLG